MKTAMQELIERLSSIMDGRYALENIDVRPLLKLEKQQIIDARLNGYNNSLGEPLKNWDEKPKTGKELAEQYFNKTYKQ